MAQPLWFRMWSEAKNDAKLDALSDAEFRCWFKLICAASENEPRGEVETSDHELLALELRVDEAALESALQRMERLRLVQFDGTVAVFPSWDDRQYEKPSDRPEATRERKRRQREKGVTSEGVTPMSRDVTPTSREGVTPTEQNRAEQSRADAREVTPFQKAHALIEKTYGNVPPLKQRERLRIMADNYGPDVITRLRYGISKAAAAGKPNSGYAIGCAESASRQEIGAFAPVSAACPCGGDSDCPECLGTGRQLTREEWEELRDKAQA